MKLPLLLRLGLDGVAISLLLISFAYDLLGNASHEIVGTSMFLLLLSHNLFNRRWYARSVKEWRQPRGAVTRLINLSLLATMLALLWTSVIISQAVFSFLPLNSDFTSRQIHAMAAYLVLIIASVHLGLHWTLIMNVVRSRMGFEAKNPIRTTLLRIAAIIIAAVGVRSLVVVDVGSKLLMQVSFGSWDVETESQNFLLHHLAITGLFATVTHYGMKLGSGPINLG